MCRPALQPGRANFRLPETSSASTDNNIWPTTRPLTSKIDMAKKSDSSYGDARRAFDDLKVEEKARFVLEAVFSTVADGIDRVSQVISDGFDQAVTDCEPDEASDEPKKSSRKTGTSRKRAAKKTSTRKKSSSSRKSGDTDGA